MRKTLAATIIAPLLLGVAILSGCQSEAQKHLYKAEDLFEKRNLEAAYKELQKSVKLDPNLLDAQKSLAHVAEYLGKREVAAQAYDKASELDPMDKKILAKARYYRALKKLAESTDQALVDIKAGNVKEGVGTLKQILRQTRTKSAREKAIATLAKAGAFLAQKGDEALSSKKYTDALLSYDQAIRAFMLVAQANGSGQMPAESGPILRSINQAAKEAGTPDATFRVLNDVLTVDPENEIANMELAQVYLRRKPPDYMTAADLEERAGAPDEEVRKLRARAKRRRRS